MGERTEYFFTHIHSHADMKNRYNNNTTSSRKQTIQKLLEVVKKWDSPSLICDILYMPPSYTSIFFERLSKWMTRLKSFLCNVKAELILVIPSFHDCVSGSAFSVGSFFWSGLADPHYLLFVQNFDYYNLEST